MAHLKLIGMDLFDVNNSGILELQKEDAVCDYESDDDAWLDFINILSSSEKNDAARAMAVRLLENWRPYMANLARDEWRY